MGCGKMHFAATHLLYGFECYVIKSVYVFAARDAYVNFIGGN